MTTTATRKIVRGVTLTPPVIGRITMGHTVVRGDKTLPVKDDHFSLTTLIQNKSDRSWEEHPLQKSFVKGKEKLRAIPVRIAYNDPSLNLNNSFSAFDTKTGRVLCTGNGEKARRVTEEGVKEIVCSRPEACEYAQRNRCKNMSRAYFRIEGQEDELGTFILRSTSYNTLNSLATRIGQLHELTDGKIAGMPMLLVMRTKTTTQSFREPIQYADLVTRDGMTLLQAVAAAKEFQEAFTAVGLSLDKMEESLIAGLANSDFADDIEDVDEWISDDDLIAAAAAGNPAAAKVRGLPGMDSLTEKLNILQNQAAGSEPQAPAAGDGPAEPIQETLVPA